MNKSFTGKSAAVKLRKAFAILLSCSTLVWAMGVGALSLVAISANTANAAAATAHPNGVLVDIGDANHTIYLISGGKRLGIPSPTVFASHGYSFDKVVTANSFDQALAEGDVIKYADSTLVRVGQEISLIGNGQKRGFTAPEVFTGLGYSFSGSNIVVPEDGYAATLAAYTTGTPIASATEAHPNGSLVNVNGTVCQISNSQLVGIPSMEVLNSRGLSLSNVVAANAADKALTVASENMKFADGTLVLSAADNMTVYVISDGKKMGVTTPAALEAYGYEWGNLVKGDVATYTDGVLITDGTVNEVVTGTNSVSLAADTPAGSTVARGAQDVEFAKYTFTAADETGYTISSMSITRGGVSISADTDLTAVELYIGTARQGSPQALNTTTHKAVFTGLNIAVTKSAPKTVIVKGDVYSSASASNVLALGIAAAIDITTNLTASLSGTFPIYSTAKTIATASVGAVTVDTLSTPAASNINSGSTEQQVASIKFTASATEAINVNSFRLTNAGTSGDADVSNITVKYGATTLATVAGFANSMATISLSPALSLNASASKNVDIYVNVASGINTSRTVRMEVTQSTDVSATGTGGVVTVSAAGTFPEQGAEHTISQGSLTTAKDSAMDPSAQNYVKGTSSRNVTALRFSTGATEGARVTQVTLTSAGTVTYADVSNFAMWRKLADTEAAQTGDITEDGYKWRNVSSGTISGTSTGFTVQFGTNTTSFDTPGLFDVAKSDNQIVRIKADVSSSATAGRTIIMSVSSASHIKADGLGSQKDIPSASVTGTTTGSTLTVADSGSLTVSINSGTPAATTVGKGNTDIEFTKVNLVAGTGENILVSSITFRTYKDGAGTGTVAATDDITDVKLYDGTTPLGTAVPRPNSGVATFNANLLVTAGTTKTLIVKGTIPTGTTASSLHIDLPGAGTIADDIVSDGVSSQVSITETGSVTGNLMTIGTPSIVASMSASLGAVNKVVNSTAQTIGRLELVAGAGDNVKVSAIKIRFDDATALNSASSANSYLGNIKLVDKENTSIQYGEEQQITDGTADYAHFTGISNLTVSKSGTKYIDVQANVLAGSGTFYCGIAAGDITGSGSLSSSPVTSTGTGYNAGVTIRSYGTVTTAVDTNSPAEVNQPVGTVGLDNIEVAKFKFTTEYEAVKIKTLTVTTNSANYNDAIEAVKLYAGGVQIGQSKAFSGTNTTLTFDMTDNPYELAADADTIITVKCDFNGVGSGVGGGVTQGDSPRISIADPSSNITYLGSQSNSTSITDATSSALNPNLQYLYKTTATVALATVGNIPSSVSELGSMDVFGGEDRATSGAQDVMAIIITNNGSHSLTITSLDLTAVTSGTPTGTSGIDLYWSDNMSQIIGSGGVAALTNGTEVEITLNTSYNTLGAWETNAIIVKADTTGMATDKSFRLDIPTVADFGWTPSGGSEVLARTKSLPITGPNYSY